MSGVFSIAYNANNENLLEGSFVYLIFCSSLAMTIKIWICKTFEMIKLADGILPVICSKMTFKRINLKHSSISEYFFSVWMTVTQISYHYNSSFNDVYFRHSNYVIISNIFSSSWIWEQ